MKGNKVSNGNPGSIPFSRITYDWRTVSTIIFVVASSTAGFYAVMRAHTADMKVAAKELVTELDGKWQSRVEDLVQPIRTDIAEIKDYQESNLSQRMREIEKADAEVQARLSVMEGYRILPEARERVTALEKEVETLKTLVKELRK